VASANPDAGQADGVSQVQQVSEIPGINSHDEKSGKENDEPQEPLWHGQPPAGKKT
jgi:hypothetical protein